MLNITKPPTPIYINGRFLAQTLAGVQRYAMEMSRALRAINPDRVIILAPNDAAQAGLGEQRVGRMRGQLWEQCELPLFAKDGLILNLGNTAPLVRKRQAVVIHDAGVFSTPEAYSQPFRLWYKFLQAGLVRNGSQIITVSNFSKSQISTFLNIPMQRIRVAGEGVDHMNRIEANQEVLTTQNLLPGKYVLAVGTLAAHKNIASLHLLSDRLAASGMVLAITGGFGAAAFSASGSQNLPASARYLGRVSDEELKALYQNAACFVFPSRYEGFGLPPLEAMACGCAVVASDIPALRETCGQGAVYCNGGSADAIADAVIELLNDAARLMQMRAAAQLHAAPLTWNNAAGELAAAISLSAASVLQ